MTPRDKEVNQQEKAAPQAGDEAAEAPTVKTGGGDKPPSDPERLREEIGDTREELGETVEALAQKVDVKAQAQEKLEEGKQQLREAQQHVKAKLEETAQRQVPLGAVVAVSLGVLLLLRLLRRR